MIRKLRACLVQIEAFYDCWGWSVVGDLENGGQAAAEDVVWIFEVS